MDKKSKKHQISPNVQLKPPHRAKYPRWKLASLTCHWQTFWSSTKDQVGEEQSYLVRKQPVSTAIFPKPTSAHWPAWRQARDLWRKGICLVLASERVFQEKTAVSWLQPLKTFKTMETLAGCQWSLMSSGDPPAPLVLSLLCSPGSIYIRCRKF